MPPLGLLALALLALAIGPLVLARLENRRVLLTIDGFVLGSIGALVLTRVLVDSMGQAGASALVAIALGMALPLAAEGVQAVTLIERGVMWLAVLALTAHAALDGAALSQSAGDPGLAAAVVVHRIPSGLFVFWLIRPRSLAIFVLILDALATTLGFFVGGQIEALHGSWAAWFAAFVAGSLLHIVVGHGPEAQDRSDRTFGALGAIVGVGLSFLIPEGHDHEDASGWAHQFAIAAPWLLGGAIADFTLFRWTRWPIGLGVVAALSLLKLGGAVTLLWLPFVWMLAERPARRDQPLAALAPLVLASVASGFPNREGSVPALLVVSFVSAFLARPGQRTGLRVPFPLLGFAACVTSPEIGAALMVGPFVTRAAFDRWNRRGAILVGQLLGAACGFAVRDLGSLPLPAPSVGTWATTLIVAAAVAVTFALGPRETINAGAGFEEES